MMSTGETAMACWDRDRAARPAAKPAISDRRSAEALTTRRLARAAAAGGVVKSFVRTIVRMGRGEERRGEGESRGDIEPDLRIRGLPPGGSLLPPEMRVHPGTSGAHRPLDPIQTQRSWSR